jgi:hypothetical protein
MLVKLPGNSGVLIDDLVKNSVNFNGVLIPPSGLDIVLSKYVECLVVWNNHDTYLVSLVGSGIPIKFKGKYFIVCSKHQLRDRVLEDVSLLSRDGKKCFSSGGVRHFEGPNEYEYRDLVAFDFSDPCAEHPELRDRFYNLVFRPNDVMSDQFMVAVASGFAFDDQNYDLEENNHLGLVKRKLACRLDGRSSDPSIYRLETVQTLNFNPDGMSGGSVFAIQKQDNELVAFLAGMIVRAGPNHIHFVILPFIWRFLEDLVGGRYSLSP